MWSSMHSFCPLTETVTLTIQPALPMVLAVHICKLSSYVSHNYPAVSLWSHCNRMQGFNSSSCVLVYRHFKEPFRTVTRALSIILSWRHFLIYVHKLGGPFLSWLLTEGHSCPHHPDPFACQLSPQLPQSSSPFQVFPFLELFWINFSLTALKTYCILKTRLSQWQDLNICRKKGCMKILHQNIKSYENIPFTDTSKLVCAFIFAF